MLDNEQGVTQISMQGRIRCFCPMGDDWYSADVEITVANPVTIPDYCEVDRFLAKLDGMELILEQACSKTHAFIKEQTGGYVTVSVKTKDATHLPVTVTVAR